VDTPNKENETPIVAVKILPDNDIDFETNVDITAAISILQLGLTKLSMIYLQSITMEKERQRQAEAQAAPSLYIPR
jgi:hypothetical protein